MYFNLENSVTRADALKLLTEQWRFAPATEYAALFSALGRVTAKDIYSENTLPVCRTSPYDGIAVHLNNFALGLPDTLEWSKGKDYVPADTGDDFPDEFDAVIAVEDIAYDEQGRLYFTGEPELIKSNNLNQPGSMLKEGELLMTANTKLTPPHLALLAMGGIHHVPVWRKPRVAFIPTGDELISAGIKPLRGQNIDANSLMAEGFLSMWGAEPLCFPIVKDNKAELESALDQALEMADIVLINGGSSKGAEDYNSTLMQERSSFFRHGVRAVPGRPVAISIIDGKPVINVPGPVQAAFLAFDWCVCGLVHHYLGLRKVKRPVIKAKLLSTMQPLEDFEMLLRVNLLKTEGIYTIEPLQRKSGTIKALNCDGLLTIPPGAKGYDAGDEVEVELLKGWEYFES